MLSYQEKQFERDRSLAQRNHTQMQPYIDEGYAVEVTPHRASIAKIGRIWYLPHHGVTSAAKPDKLRLVFNCSAHYKGASLNDNLLKGPDLLTNLFGMLLRIILNPIAVSADIKGMFHQVGVAPVDQSDLRLVYRPPGTGFPLKAYQMTRHVFGVISLLTACIYAVNHAGDDAEDIYPNIGSKLAPWTYADHIIYLVEDVETSSRYALTFIDICQRGGFTLRQLMSNSREVLHQLQPEQLSKSNLDLKRDSLPIEKVLGVWID